jgi:hypothetical protein
MPALFPQPANQRATMRRRHTKPCRYFQQNRCRYSAEACHFLHVLITQTHETHPIPTHTNMPKKISTRNRVCKYYTAGYCKSGSACHYLHPMTPETFQFQGYCDPYPAQSQQRLQWSNEPECYSFESQPPVTQPSYYERKAERTIRRRESSYRSKPCRLYSNGGVCPNGAYCHFLHDPTNLVSNSRSQPQSITTRPRPTEHTSRVLGGGVKLSNRLLRTPERSSGGRSSGPPSRQLSPVSSHSGGYSPAHFSSSSHYSYGAASPSSYASPTSSGFLSPRHQRYASPVSFNGHVSTRHQRSQSVPRSGSLDRTKPKPGAKILSFLRGHLRAASCPAVPKA